MARKVEIANDPPLGNEKELQNQLDAALKALEESREYASGIERKLHELTHRAWNQQERVHAEEALRESEEKYRNLFNAIDEGYCIIEMLFDEQEQPVDYRFLEANVAFARQTGIEDAEGRTMKEIAPGHEAYWFDIYGNVALTGKPVRFENRAEQLQRFYDLYAFRVGKPEERKVAVIFNDISKRKQAERLLQEQNNLLELIASGHSLNKCLQELANAITRLEPHTRAVILLPDEVRQRFATSFTSSYLPSFRPGSGNYGIDIFAGKPVTSTNIADDARWSQSWKDVCAAEGILACYSEPVTGAYGEPLAAVMLCFDRQREPGEWDRHIARLGTHIASIAIKRHQAEEALRRSEENYRAIVNQSIAGIMKIDLSGNIIFANDQFAKMLGYSMKELMQLTVADLIYGEDAARNNALFSRLINEGRAYEIEKRLAPRSGPLIWVNNHISPIFDSGGNPQSAVIISVDITRQKAMERQKDEFIGIASHELKTPLTSIKAYGEILKEMFTESGQANNAILIGKLNGQVDRLANLVYSLLDATRISGGQLALQRERIDLDGLIEERIQETQVIAPKHRLVFRRGSCTRVLADRERIGQVLDNLLSNAVKYSPAGGDVIITSEDTGSSIKVSVRDFGIGITAVAQKKVFERFYRVNSTPAEFISGIGLGLYIATEIIKKHNGLLGVESDPDKGSLFYFELPYEADVN